MPRRPDHVLLVTQVGNMLVAGIAIIWNYTSILFDMQQVQGIQGDDPRAAVPLIAWVAVASWALLVASVLLVERGQGYPLGRRLAFAVISTLAAPLMMVLIHRWTGNVPLPWTLLLN